MERGKGRDRFQSREDKPKSHIIGIKAVTVFKNALPPEDWTSYDISPDYWKDNKVEIVENGRHTGICFWVQIKGQEKVTRLRDGSVSFGMETQDLDYFFKLKNPIFLFVIDVTEKTGHWVFLQGYERSVLRNAEWWDQDKIQIHLPAENNLVDLVRLKEAVLTSHQFMNDREMRRGIFEEKEQLEAIDPRFRADITIGVNGKHYHLETDQPVHFDIDYKDGDPSSGKIEDLLDRGKTVTFRRGEIEFKGMPLLDHLVDKHGGDTYRFQFQQSAEGTARLSKREQGGAVQATIEAIPCKMIYGKTNVRFEASLHKDLLAVTMEVPYSGADRRPMALNINLMKWVGHRLMNLPAFEAIDDFFGHIDGGRVEFECFLPGYQILNAVLDPREDDFHNVIRAFLTLIRKARAIAALKGVNPVLPDDICSRANVDDINWLYDVLVGGGHERAFTGAVTVTVGRAGLRQFLNDIEGPVKTGLLELTSDVEGDFLGEKVSFKSITHKVTEASLVGKVARLQEDLKKNPAKRQFKMVWRPTKKSRWFTSCPPDAQLSA
jgi:hypothetical protein